MTAAAPFRDWLWANVLMQRHLREMSCPVASRGAYITKHRAADPGGINRNKSITSITRLPVNSSRGWMSL